MSEDRGLEDVLARLDAGELGDPLPVLAYLAGRTVVFGQRDVHEAQRRAMLLLAAGGDPRRELDVDDRPVKALAADIHTDERQAQLGGGVDELVTLARDLPRARKAALFLAADLDLAWRLFALGLLAEALDEEGD